MKYELRGDAETGYCLKRDGQPGFIPLDAYNRDCRKYMDAVAAGDVADVLPDGELDKLKAQLAELESTNE